MSVRVMSWVWENSASTGADRLVLLAIADSANDAGRDAYPAMTTIARKANLDKRTAQRSVRALVALGELAVLENAGPHGCHRYRIVMAEGRQSTTGGDTPPLADDHGGDTPPVASDPVGGGISSTLGWQDATRTILNPSSNHPKNITSEKLPVPIRQDVERLCVHLADRIEANGSKRPKITKAWRTDARLMLDNDNRTEERAHRAIDWCQSDEFWRSVILSMHKLREKYDQLRLAAERPKGSTTDDRVGAGLALAAKLRADERREINA